MILDFLHEFAKLSPAEQKVFLFCLEKLPRPQAYSGDLQRISVATGLYYQTVRKALYSISALPTLSKVVKYIHSDVSRATFISFDAIGDLNGNLMGWSELEARLTRPEKQLDLRNM